MGTGASITVDLSEDVIHNITATAEDSEGRTGSDSVEVTVGVVVVPVDPKGEFRNPMFIGISSGSDRLISMKGSLFCTVGTSGLFLVGDNRTPLSGDDDVLYILSNNHVYAQEGEGVVGDRILQPGRVDLSPGCGTTDERNGATIGTLAAFADIEFSRRANNIVDAAVALVTEPGVMGVDFLNQTPSNGYGAVSSNPPVVAASGMVVHKYGRTIGPTSGTVTGINASLIIRYDSGRARFDGQIVITGTEGSFSASGDSGALVVDASNNPVGLHFAGSSSTSIANPIGDVITAMEDELLGESLTIG